MTERELRQWCLEQALELCRLGVIQGAQVTSAANDYHHWVMSGMYRPDPAHKERQE
jgi:hypothetical protein